jgi:thymidylate kinase
MFGDRIENKLSGGVNADAWSEVEAQTWAMRRALVWRAVSRRPMATLATLWADLRRLTGRLRHPPGLTVVLLGPDGSGKSTVAKAVQVSLSSTFKVDKSLVLHWKPIVFFRRRRLGGPPTTNPHGSKPRNGLGSLAALGFHWLEYFLGGMLEILPVRFRNGLVLFDRYFYDFEVDPRRFRLALPWHWPLRMFRALPAPDLIFLLDVSPETMLARKQEVSLAELQRQREAFRSVVSRLPNGTILPSERPIESVVSDMAQSILEHLRNRQAQRMEFELTNPDSA